MDVLTEKQYRIYTFLKEFREEQGYPPTIREIGSKFEINIRAVRDHIKALERKGYISIAPKVARGIRII